MRILYAITVELYQCVCLCVRIKFKYTETFFRTLNINRDSIHKYHLAEMCIIFFVLNENAKNGEFKLILASNRDEFYLRPSSVAARWAEDEYIIGGRDMVKDREGGTWLAISTKNNTFKFGALLNITGEQRDDDALPRGHIVVDYLKNPVSNAEYCYNLCKMEKKFTSFNLITIEIRC